VKLLNPAGANVYINNNSDNDVGPFTLTDSGTYTLIIDGNGSATGDYSFRLDDLSTAQPLALNSIISGQLAPRSETDLYQFNGVSGQRIHPDSISASSGEANWYLIGPANQNLVSGGIT